MTKPKEKTHKSCRQNSDNKTSGEARRRSCGSRLSSLKSGDAKKVFIPISIPWHISWMIRSFTES